MLRKCLLLLLISTAITSTAWAQDPLLVPMSRQSATPRSPLDCAAAKAGGTLRTLSPNNKNKTDIRYLCLGDTLFLAPNGQANVSNDVVPATPPGIGYFFYTCKPTINGPTAGVFETDPCLLLAPGPVRKAVVSTGNPAGRDTFFNGGGLQLTYGNRRPLKLYFAPVTLTRFFGPKMNPSISGFDANADCIDVNINDNQGANDTFSVVYLNAIKVNMQVMNAAGGTFEVTGGLPEYDGVSVYAYTIALASNPAIRGVVTSANNGAGTTTVKFTVPQPGIYTITATDNKSCDGQVLARCVNDVAIIASNEITQMGNVVCAKVSAVNFKNIISAQCIFNFDPSIFTFIDMSNPALPSLNSSNFYLPSGSNNIIFTWNGPSTTKADSATLFELCFRAIGRVGAVSPVRITDSIDFPIEISENDTLAGDGTSLGVTVKNGSLTIGNLDFTIIKKADDARCAGENGKFRINIAGAGAPFQYTWQSATNAAQTGVGTINTVADTAFVLNRPAGRYYITVTNAGNVQKLDTVDIKEPPVLFLNSPISVNPSCANDRDGSLTIPIGSYGGGTPNYTFKWSTGATTTAITNLAAGPYGITITDANGCKDSVPRLTLGVNPITVTAQKTDATCKGVKTGAVRILSAQGGTTVGGVYTFTWSTGATNVGTTSTISGLEPGTYFLSIKDRNNCERKDTFKIDALRSIETNAVVQSVACYGFTTGFINATASTRGPEAQPYTFAWTGIVGAPTNTNTTTFVRNLAAGTYSLTIKDRDNCQLDTSFTIKQPDSIRLALVTLANESCTGSGTNGTNGAVTIAASGGTAPYKYAWSRNSLVDTFPSISGLRAGIYTLMVTDSARCTNTRAYTISAPVFPRIDSFRIKNASCSDRNDGNARVFYKAGTGTTIASVKWSNTGFLDSISSVLGGNYTVTVTADNGCQRVDTARILSPARIQYDAVKSSKIDPACPREPTGRIIIIMKGGTEPYSYKWSGGPSSQTGAVFGSLEAGTYKFTITDSNGCTPDSTTVTLVDPPTVKVVFTDDEDLSCYRFTTTACDGKRKATASGGTANNGLYSFAWSSGETTSNATSSKAVKLCRGWQTVTVSDQLCTYPPDSLFVKSPDSLSWPTPPVVMPTCKGDRDGSVEIRVQGGTQPYTYLWSNGSTRNSIVNVAKGTYSVTVTDAKFCVFDNKIIVNEPDSFKIDTIPLNSQNVTCFGLSDGEIRLRRTGGNGSPLQTTYNWTPSVSQSDSAKNLKAGVYTIRASDTKGCNDSLTIEIRQPDPIYFVLAPLTQPRCNGELTTIQIDAAFGSTYMHPFSASVDNGPESGIGTQIPVFAGRHVINIIEQETRCTLDTAVTISEPPPLQVRFDTLNLQNQLSKILVGLGDSVRINPLITSVLPIDSVSWTPKTYLSFRGDPLRPFTRPLDDITYKLTVVDVNGCSASEQLMVELDRNRNIFVPNVFSPNDDGFNDYFGVFNGVGVKMINFVRVFDRWGEMLFSKEKIVPGTDISQGWNGTFRGRVVDNGVYIYIIEVEFEDGQKLLYRGDVTVVR